MKLISKFLPQWEAINIGVLKDYEQISGRIYSL